MTSRNSKRVLHVIRGAATIADLFAGLVRHAASLLGGADIAALLQHPVGDVAGLGWVSAKLRAELVEHVDGLAQRATTERLRLRKPERDRLLAMLGGAAALEDPRLAFIVAQTFDERYLAITPRVAAGSRSGAVELPANFLSEATNAPPPLGQMTPLAACRRWMRAFWYVGDIRKLDAFGPLPIPTSRELPARARQTLQRGADEGEIRVAIASWRRHSSAQLVRLAASPGCFAFAGLNPEPPAAELAEVLAHARRMRSHLLLFPELAFSTTGFQTLLSLLAGAEARFPALIALGRAHQPRARGGYTNSGMLLDAAGHVLLEHEKIEPFSVGQTVEDIVPRESSTYEYLDTPLGRLVINVCRDVRSDVPMVMNRALGVSLLVVPAYSRRLDFVLEEARILGARQMTITLAANPPSENVRDGGLLYAPIRGEGSSVVRSVDLAPSGTIHAFTIRRGAAGVTKLDAEAPVTL